ncbi:MAG: 30S ribosomal protein S1, partial [Anaerotruncus colihominis]
MPTYKPEGMLIDTVPNRQAFKSMTALMEAQASGRILESRAIVCDSNHNLIVDMGAWRGIIPRDEAALGIAEGTTRDIAIISRVNKPVCYRITGFERGGEGIVIPQLSRRAVQQECQDTYISKLVPGDVIDAKVTHLESFGCFVDIGCGLPSLI